MSDQILKGDGTWKFTAAVEGEDIVVRDVTATWFGGANDPLDNGDTASGISTKAHPGILACSLPMDGFRNVPSTKGSPIPRVEWLTLVKVLFPNGLWITVPVIDLGPAKSAGDALDLTVPAFVKSGVSLKEGVIKGVSYWILGGARFVPKTLS